MLPKLTQPILSAAIFSCLFFTSAQAEKPYHIVSIQHQSFLPYELSLKGFKKGISQSDMADKITLEAYNAESDISALDMFIKKVGRRDDVDLILSIGTQSTRRIIKKIKTIPIVFTDLGAPETSGIITDWKGSGANFTGVETRDYVGIGIHLLHELMAFRSIGLIYLKGSPSHEGTVKKITELSQNAEFEFHARGFALRDENNKNFPREVVRENIQSALDEIAPKVDVFYVQISNTFDQNFDLFFDCFKKHSLPSAGEPIYIKKGLVIGIGRDKEKFGYQSAEYAVKILKGADPGKMPMDTGKHFSISLNIEAATIVGYNPSIDILGAADEIYREIDARAE